jgi:hypothetical protein
MIMTRRIVTAAVLPVILMLVWTSAASGASLLGPPTCSLKQGQFGLTGEYAYSAEDVKISNARDKSFADVKINAFLGKPAYGIAEDWEIYGLFGASNIDFEGINLNEKFAYGFGTKITFSKDANVSCGVLFELNWNSGRGSGTLDLTDVNVNLPEDDYSIDMDYREMIIAIGPTWKVTNCLKVYGGPFFYVLEGNVEVQSEDVDKKLNLGTKAMFGGYFGAEMNLCENSSLFGEFQFTGERWVFGTGIGWKF